MCNGTIKATKGCHKHKKRLVSTRIKGLTFIYQLLPGDDPGNAPGKAPGAKIGPKPNGDLVVVVVVVVVVFVTNCGMIAAPNEPRINPIGKSAIMSVLPSLVAVEFGASVCEKY